MEILRKTRAKVQSRGLTVFLGTSRLYASRFRWNYRAWDASRCNLLHCGWAENRTDLVR